MKDIVPTITPLVQQMQTNFTRPTGKYAAFLALNLLDKPESAKITDIFLHRAPIPTALGTEEIDADKLSALYAFFSRASWTLNSLACHLLMLLSPYLGDEIVLLVDDTLVRRTGRFVIGGGAHHDPLAHQRKGKPKPVAFGLNFVVLAVWIPVEGIESGGMAVPLFCEIYRSKSTCPEGIYRKRTEIAAELVDRACRFFPTQRLLLVGDREYASKTVLQALPRNHRGQPRVHMVGTLPSNAQLHDLHVNWWVGKRGPKPTWGPKMKKPEEILVDEDTPWASMRVRIYGKDVVLEYKEVYAVWKSAGADMILKVVITRDPEGHLPHPGYFFSTDMMMSATEVVVAISRRWPIETMFRRVKQELKLETMQLGFQRNEKRQPKKAGPQADPEREPVANRRFVGFAFYGYGLVIAWWLANGNAKEAVSRARVRRPWYRQKKHLSGEDIFYEFRQQLQRETFQRPQVVSGVSGNTDEHHAAQAVPRRDAA